MKTIALFFGGLSNEAAVSIMSARNIAASLDKRHFRLRLVYWRKSDRRFYLVKGFSSAELKAGRELRIEEFKRSFEVALPITHGRYGEDGILQAIFESQGVKYCGCRVLGSALCMDKGAFKDMMKASGIEQVGYWIIDYKADSASEIAAKMRQIKKMLPGLLFIKPANSGSSVGVSRVSKPTELPSALRLAKQHDSRVIIEKGLAGPREIEVAVLGNSELLVSQPGELALAKDFYDYNDKYTRGEAKPVIPARLSSAQMKRVRELATRAYRLANCQGFARVDFFLSRGRFYLNEINTLPGFTDISMFPMLMAESGLDYKELLRRIINLALLIS